MIVADRKPYEEIRGMLAGYKRVLVAGCGSCVAVCNTGGEKEVGILAEQLRMTAKMENTGYEVSEATALRQCETEFLQTIKAQVDAADAVVSLACGAGTQLLAATFPSKPVFPGVNTSFLGTNIAPGIWAEYCHGCGSCVLGETGGICPVARCSKGLVNGACGGTTKGMCEVDPKTIDCGWYLIYKRLKDLNRLDLLRKMNPPKDWSKDRGAGPRRLSREDMTRIEAGPAEQKGN